jgi:hypothetical protein
LELQVWGCDLVGLECTTSLALVYQPEPGHALARLSEGQVRAGKLQSLAECCPSDPVDPILDAGRASHR